jgi:hypothetical protein
MLATGVGFVTVPAKADIIDDPLHGECFAQVGSTVSECVDHGSFTDIAASPYFNGTNFGFSISPAKGHTGDFQLIVAVPTNDTQPAVGTNVTGNINGGAPISVGISFLTTWGPGTSTPDLDALTAVGALFPSASPPNTFNNAISSAKTQDSGATAFDLYSVDIGSIVLDSNSKFEDGSVADFKSQMDLSVGTGLPVGSEIFGFFNDNNGVAGTNHWIATASSGLLLVNNNSTTTCTTCTTDAPEPAGLSVLGVGLLGLGFVASRKRSA